MRGEWIVDVTAAIECARQSTTAETVALSKRSIFRVPKIFRDRNKDAYTPKMASFGPYHYGQEHLMPMEEHKHRVLHNFFLKRSKKSVAEVAEMTRNEVRELIESYDGLEEQWTNHENRFLELMIHDGCFLLECLLALDSKQLESLDPIFSKKYIRDTLLLDVMLVENQLPMPVLAILLDAVDDYEITQRLSYGIFQGNVRGWGLHVLDVARKVAVRGCYSYDPLSVVPPATELFEAGVRIPTSKSNGRPVHSYYAISFSDGVLKISPIFVHDQTEAQLLNYIAFEHLRCESLDVTSYVFFMDGLINTAADVALLRKKGIIHGWMGSDDDVAALFSRLTKGLSFDFRNNNGKNVNQELNMYCRRTWPKWRASFVHTYLRNPWLFNSLLGALILLVLSAFQTVYTMLSYYHHC